MPRFQFDSIATHSGNSGKGKQHFLLRQAAFEVELEVEIDRGHFIFIHLRVRVSTVRGSVFVGESLSFMSTQLIIKFASIY